MDSLASWGSGSSSNNNSCPNSPGGPGGLSPVVSPYFGSGLKLCLDPHPHPHTYPAPVTTSGEGSPSPAALFGASGGCSCPRAPAPPLPGAILVPTRETTERCVPAQGRSGPTWQKAGLKLRGGRLLCSVSWEVWPSLLTQVRCFSIDSGFSSLDGMSWLGFVLCVMTSTGYRAKVVNEVAH